MITFKCETNKELEKEIKNRLREFNNSQREWLGNRADKIKNKSFFAFDGDKLIGGAVGYMEYNWYYLDLLFVEGAYRKQKIGSRLLSQVEDYARKEKLTGVRMETWDFQALGFYKSNGYEIFGKIEDCPPGTTEYHLKKVL